MVEPLVRRRRSLVCRATGAQSEVEGWLDLALVVIQLCAWLFPFPERVRLMPGSLLRVGLVLRALAARVSGLAFQPFGGFALVVPLAGIVLLRQRANPLAIGRCVGGWLSVATILAIGGFSRASGAVGTRAVAILEDLTGSPWAGRVIAGFLALALLVWVLRLGPALARAGHGAASAVGHANEAVAAHAPAIVGRLAVRMKDLATRIWRRYSGFGRPPETPLAEPKPAPTLRTAAPSMFTPAGTLIEPANQRREQARRAPDAIPDASNTAASMPVSGVTRPPTQSTSRAQAQPNRAAISVAEPSEPPADEDEIPRLIDSALASCVDLPLRLRRAAARKARRLLTESGAIVTPSRVRAAAAAAVERARQMDARWAKESERMRNSVANVRDLVYDAAPIDYDFVAGMDELKRDLSTIIRGSLVHADMVERITGERPKGAGILLYGAPGCGKTFFAVATAGEFAQVYGLRIVHAGMEAVKGLHWSKQIARIGEIFSLAEELAPCVVIWDEFDAYASDAQKTRRKYDAEKAAQFKQRFEGSVRSDRFVVHVATTNWPWQIELPLLRPGRLGIVRQVPAPDEEARREMIDMRVESMRLDERLDINSLADWCKGNTAAEIGAFLEAAAQRAVADNLASPLDPERGVTVADFEAARSLLDRRSFPAWLQQARYELARPENAPMREYLPELGTR
ncbi:MAG: AAA family ATPase [Acidobacteriia bacterium]|nr:AAA family ATPase [Terriglobia bacterium]